VTAVELMDLRQSDILAQQVGSRSAMALPSNHWRCKRHSLPGANSR
jgi:hypothetical protein